MAVVHYKFKSAKNYDSIAIEDHFISVGNFKEKIFELKHLGRGTDFDLVVTNAQTNEEYLDEGMLIPKNASVLIRRVPGLPRKPIVIAPVIEQEGPILEHNSDEAVKGSFSGAEASSTKYAEDIDWDEFGNDIYAIPETVPSQSSIKDALTVTKEDEDSKIKALIDTPALDWQHQPSDGFGPCRGSGRMTGAHGFGRGGFDQKKTPQGYICHRCKVPGHFIQHCPTNGDPTYDIKRVRPPTGIPRSMLMTTPDGCYTLPSGDVAVLKPNEAAFEKEMEGMPSKRSFVDLPPELHCPMCKGIMKDAVFASKCCYTSYCDKCIRDYIISTSNCICGATNILADDLLPNKTLRDTINRMLESNNGSTGNTGSSFKVQGSKAKVPTATKSAGSREQQLSAPSLKRKETSSDEQNKTANAVQKQEKGKSPESLDVTNGSRIVEEEPLRESGQLVGGGKMKKRKKMHWRSAQDLALDNPHPCHMPYYMGYGFGPTDVSFGGVLPRDPHGCMLPYGPPQRYV
ncbi:hypothetical protein ACJIZ3_002898 [Penstemon smallii]|uniref:DWNN domain-containing protein n=1 Tax=Penstemon smallii TaxID=265156 RepID=A0ABD3U841_9LAMI